MHAFDIVGPFLDSDAALDRTLIVERITFGQGAMPGYDGQVSKADIDLLASYIMQGRT